MKLSIRAVLLTMLGLLSATAVMADEVEFRVFETTHDKGANQEAKFPLYVRQTNLMDYRVDEQDEHKCIVKPGTPASWSCKVAGEWLWLDDSETAARAVLKKYGVDPQQIVELTKKEAGVYQVVLGNDDVFHLTMKAPKVIDNSMVCELAVNRDKMTGWIRCSSEFNKSESFLVRNLPVLEANGFYQFGVESPRLSYYEREKREKEYREQHAAKIALVRQVVLGVGLLKKMKILSDDATPYNFAFDLRQKNGRGIFLVQSGNRAPNYVEGVNLDGKAELYERGALRRGN